MAYKNSMELIVNAAFDKVSKELGACTCEGCRNDAVAKALNMLPAHYVVSNKGEAITKAAYMLNSQLGTDVIRIVSQCIRAVQDHPQNCERGSGSQSV